MILCVPGSVLCDAFHLVFCGDSFMLYNCILLTMYNFIVAGSFYILYFIFCEPTWALPYWGGGREGTND